MLSRIIISRRWLLILAVALAPAFLSLILVTAYHKDVTHFIPTWNDEVGYWHQILTFRQVGFQGGYYTVFELPPPAEFTHFYTYGPWSSMLFGVISLVAGWGYTSALLVNTILLAVALVIFCVATRMDTPRLLMTGVLVATFWPLQIYLFSNMQEILHQIIAVIGAAIFYLIMRRKEPISRRWLMVWIVFWFAAGVLRLSWIILYPPFFILVGSKSIRGILLSLGKSVVLAVIVFAITQYTGAPGNNSVFTLLNNFSVSFQQGITALWSYFSTNVSRYFGLKHHLDVLLTMQVLTIAIMGGILSWRSVSRRRKHSVEVLFHTYNLTAIVIASLMLYIIATFGDYRVIGMHLLLSGLLMVAFNRRALVLFLVLTNLLLLPVFLQGYEELVIPKFPETMPDEFVSFQQVAADVLHYEANAPTAWCNTLLINVWQYNNLLLNVPGGVGISFYNSLGKITFPLKSRYVLATDDQYAALMEQTPTPRLDFIVAGPQASFYLNRDADYCDQEPG